MRRVQRFRLGHLAQTRLWLVPLACLLAGIGLALALLAIDRSSGHHRVGTSALMLVISSRAPGWPPKGAVETAMRPYLPASAS